MQPIVATLIVLVLLLLSEYWWRHTKIHSELSRKFVHISVGSFVAFWPYFLQTWQIVALSIAFIVVVGLSKRLHIFQAIHSVQRPTRGEFWFALVVGVLALVDGQPAIYTTALLMMSLSDGLAAIIGTRYGAKTRYEVFDAHKSIIGTLTFFVISCLILYVYVVPGGHVISLAYFLAITGGAAVLENIGGAGLDNLLVPLYVGTMLHALA